MGCHRLRGGELVPAIYIIERRCWMKVELVFFNGTRGIGVKLLDDVTGFTARRKRGRG